MSQNIQTIAALTIVLVTAIVMLYFRLRKKTGGCGGCGCSAKSSKDSSRL